MGRKKKTGKLTKTIREMAHEKKTGKVTATIQEIAYYNMCLTEAILELLAERGILTGPEVMERITKLKSETEFQSTLLQ
jgi:Tfp pilus assembly pilus retraction ATPase PilT